jgi:signal transduction histidine kinase
MSNTNFSVRGRVLRALVGVCALFAVLLLVLALYSQRQQTKVIDAYLAEYRAFTENMVRYQADVLARGVYDYTYWDEMVSAVLRSPPDRPWFDENVATMQESFDIDYAWVFDLTGKLVYEAARETVFGAGRLPFPEAHLPVLRQARFSRFFQLTPYGLMQLSAGTIHHTDDQERLRSPNGYLVVGRLWIRPFLGELETLAASAIRVYEPGDPMAFAPTTAPNLFHTIELKDWDGKVVGLVRFERDMASMAMIQRHLIYTISLLGGLVVAIVIALVLVFNRQVNHPLHLLSDCFDAGPVADRALTDLSKCGAEFQRIARLITDFRRQSAELLDAKQRAEQSERLQSAFLANISHEIRTPMNGILGYNDLLKDPDLSTDQRLEFIQQIERSGQLLLGIINDILDYAKVEAGGLKLYPETTCINALLRNIQGLFLTEDKVVRKQIRFSVATPLPDEDSFRLIDAMRFTQVMSNLLANAFKFTASGSVKFGYTLNEAGHMLFFVEDTGIGIPFDQQKAIFERFVQVDMSSVRNYGGAGLGLAISKSLVELMGGRIGVSSVPGKGSVFSFTTDSRK